jgi:hypothetical protein
VGEFNKHIENLIRQKFDNFEPVPPENVWEQIKPRIAGLVPPSPGSNLIFPILTFLGVIFFVVSLILNPSSLKPVSNVQAETPGVLVDNNEIPEAISVTVARLQSTTYATGEDQKSTVVSAPEANAAFDDQVVTPSNNGNPLVRNRRFRQEHSSNTFISNELPEASSQRETLARMNYQATGDISSYSQINPVFLNERKLAARHYDDYVRDRNNWWSAGLSFMPEMIFYENRENKSSQLIQADFSYHFSNLYLQSGIGFKFNSDQGAYQIDYNKYLGSYDYVYDVTFDSVGEVVVPTYHTYLVDIYDSITYYQVSETNIRYTYLDVPLMLGYWKNLGRISLFAQGGVNFSFQLGKKAVNLDYPDERIMILNVDQTSPVRLTTNMQLLGSIGVDYKLSRNFSFSAEPVFRYYLGTEYDNVDNEPQPYGIGFKAGLKYNFINR